MKTLLGLISILFAALIITNSCGTFSSGSDVDTTTIIFEGELVPTFNAVTLDEKEIRSSELRGKVILINFFATWCPPCIEELPYIESKIYKNIDDEDFVLICLGREHTAEELVKFKKEKGYDLPMAPDPEREIYSKFAKMMIPRNFVIGRDGKVIYQHIGFEMDEFEHMIKVIKDELNKGS